MPPCHKTSVVPAPLSQRSVVASLMQLYLQDMSEFTDIDISEDGLYAYPFLDHYWREPDRYPWLIHAGDETAGFALVRKLRSGVYEMAEFFILRSFRRQGIGLAAAAQLFQRFQGEWHIAQLESHRQAQTFWRYAIHEFAGQKHEETWSDESPRRILQIFRSSRS